ncbi:TonB-dependent receptor [Niveispirillum irakense]|uniref:TonB-dependent receptor n=1 Tax=Niveispirillum irakense TaxID=34011 RepID=UPI00040B4CA1|nr:TonB-dependent receptor [Niveispirillum irakense]
MSRGGADPCPGRTVAAIALGAALLAGGAAYAEPGQPHTLSDALLSLARQSGRNLLFKGAALPPRKAPALPEGASFRASLDLLLAGTGLTYREQPDGTVVILPAPPHRPVAAPPEPVAEILVMGQRPQDRFAAELRSPLPAHILPATEFNRAADRNMAELLGRLPGVNVMMTSLQGDLGGIDRAARAEGQSVAIRGLGGAYSQVLMDGINMAQSMPYSRDVQLSLLPPFGPDALHLETALTADKDGDAIGGIIDFRSASAFDLGPERTRITLRGSWASRTGDYHLSGSGGGGEMEGSRLFGRDNAIGLVLRAHADSRPFSSLQQTYQTGQFDYAITDAAGNNPAGMDAGQNLIATSLNAQFVRGRTKRRGASLALDWQPDAPYSAFLRAGWNRADTEQDVYQVGFQGGRDASFTTRLPIGNGLYQTQSVKNQLHYWFQTNPDEAELLTLQGGGEIKAGPLTLRPYLFHSWGRNDKPRHIEVSFWNSRGTTVDEGLVMADQGGYPTPLLGPKMLALLADAASVPASNLGEYTTLTSRQTKDGGGLDMETGTETAKLQAGVKRVRSDNSVTRRNQRPQDSGGAAALPPGTRLGDLAALGLSDGAWVTVAKGLYDYQVPLIDQGLLLARFRANEAGFVWTPDEYNGNSMRGQEEVTAAYLQADLRKGPFQFLPGLRVEGAKINTLYWLSGNQGVPAGNVPYGWNRGESRYKAWLPRLLVNYTPDKDQRYRLAVWTGQVRPALYQLSGSATARRDADGTLTLIQGNPDLKAVSALNVDLGGEWRWPGGHAGLSLYHKRLRHYLYDAGANYNGIADGGESGLRLLKPFNGGTAQLWGAELAAAQALTFLPDPLNALVLEASLNSQRSRVHLHMPELAPVERLQYAPDWQINSRLRYAAEDWSLSASYTWSDAYIQKYGLHGLSGSGSPMNGSGLNVWVRPSQRLDLQGDWQMSPNVALEFSIRNLLNDLAYRATIGRHSDAVPETIASGRSAQMVLRLDF